MRFIFSDNWNDAPCSHHVFYFWQWCNFSGIEALKFSSNYSCILPATADIFAVIANTCSKSIQKQIVEYDIKSQYPEEYSTIDGEKVLASKSCFNLCGIRTLLQRQSVSLAWRLDREMRRWLFLQKTGFTCLRFFTSYFIDVDTFYLFLNWFSTPVNKDQKYVRLQAIHLYKYTKIQGPRFQRNYIIARDPKNDLHGASFQSLTKINCMLITWPFAYNECSKVINASKW